LKHSPTENRKGTAQIDHLTCTELVVVAVHVPHPSPPGLEHARSRNAGQSGPRSRSPARQRGREHGFGRIERPREQCGRRIGVASGAVACVFLTSPPLSPSTSCWMERCAACAPALPFRSFSFTGLVVSWVLILFSLVREDRCKCVISTGTMMSHIALTVVTIPLVR
jgi:hypothetical protein